MTRSCAPNNLVRLQITSRGLPERPPGRYPKPTIIQCLPTLKRARRRAANEVSVRHDLLLGGTLPLLDSESHPSSELNNTLP